MLARANRLLSADDFRTTIRRGRRIPGALTVVHVLDDGTDAAARFGFIVGRKVGNAVTRNRVRRRLRAIAYGLLEDVAPGTRVVIRALPESAKATWTSLQGEVASALSRRTHA